VSFTGKQHVLQLPNDGCTTAIIENLLVKSPGQQAILILLTSSHTNPFVVDDLYLSPAVETLKQACGGGSIKSVDHLQKYVGGKYRSEVESDFSDIL